MSRYRRPKHLSLDGSISGIEPNRFRPGIKTFPTHPGAGPGHMHVEDYAQRPAAYDSNAPEYCPPDPWFEEMPHLASPPQRVAPGWPPPATIAPSTLKYRNSLMTPEMFLRLLQEISTEKPLPIEARTVHPEVMLPTGEASAQGSQSGQSMWAGPELMGEHPWFNSGQTAPEAYEAIVQATEQEGPLAEIGSQETAMQAMCDLQPPQGLEAVIQDDPFEMERGMYDHQMQQMLDPFMSPGFGPGP
jgi:hypothetical protein